MRLLARRTWCTQLRVVAEEPSKTVLLVEDDIDVRATVCELLAEEGYSVVVARNGEEALGYLRRAAILPQLVLLDLFMPVMDGWQFRAEQKRDVRLAEIPVVVYSAHKGRETIDAAAVLPKPVSLTELLETVARHILPGSRT
jgi:CheY-like chemotaxis protein